MNIKLFKNSVVFGLIIAGNLAVATPEPIEKIEKKIRADLIKGEALDIEEHFSKHAKIMDMLLKNYLSPSNNESHASHLKKIMAALAMFETHIEKALVAKIAQEQNPTKRECLSKAHAHFVATLKDFKAICKVLTEYNGSSDLFSLAGLGNKVSQWKHLLPQDIRKWDLCTWKSRLEYRMSCKA